MHDDAACAPPCPPAAARDGDAEATDWAAYAEVYDLMAEHNPAYQDLLQRIRAAVARWPLAAGSRLADLGAGTGNVSLMLAAMHPACHVVHVDRNEAMNRRAQRKAAQAGCGNLTVLTHEVGGRDGDPPLPFAAGSLSAVVTVHALYAFPEPQRVLARLHDALQPGGYLLACDAGRMSSVLGWAAHVLGAHWRRHGLAATLSFWRRARSVATLNRPLARAQRQGRLWRHTPAQFRAAIEAAGYEVVEACEVYRGNSDFVVARKRGRPVR